MQDEKNSSDENDKNTVLVKQENTEIENPDIEIIEDVRTQLESSSSSSHVLLKPSNFMVRPRCEFYFKLNK